MFKTIFAGLVIGFCIIAFGDINHDPYKNVNTGPSGYSKCLDDPNTQFMVGVYKQKYPRLSNSQIEHTLCKDK